MSKTQYLIFIIAVTLISSCSKKNNDYDNGLAVVKINFAGTQAINIKNTQHKNN